MTLSVAELSPADQDLAFQEGESVNLQLSAAVSWQIARPDGSLLAGGTGTTISFTPSDDGLYKVQRLFSFGGGVPNLVVPWFPIVVSNLAPSISGLPTTITLQEGAIITLQDGEIRTADDLLATITTLDVLDVAASRHARRVEHLATSPDRRTN